MPREHRLSRADFKQLPSTGQKRFHGDCFQLVVAPLPQGAAAKGAVIVSKKVSSVAAKRNALKRACRHVLKNFMMNETRPLAFMLIAKKAALAAPRAKLAAEIAALVAEAAR